MTDDSLFRSEALAAQGEKLMGSVVLRLPRLYRWLTLVTVFLVLLIVAFMLWGTYSRHQTTKGLVVPTQGMVKIQPSRPGFVEQLLAEEGQILEPQQVLMTINTALGLGGGTQMEKQQLEQLRASVSLLTKAREKQRAFGEAEQERLGKRIKRLKEQLYRLKQELSLEGERYALLQRQAKGMGELTEKGAVSQQEYEAKKLTALDAKLRLEQFRRGIEDRDNEIKELEAEKAQLAITQEIKLGNYERELSDLQRSLLELEGRQGYAITTPVAGQLAVLQAKAGQRVEPGRPVAVVVPQNTEYEVELLVPSYAIGLIEEGQAVKLRYQAFPFQRYGLQNGWIKDITGAGLAGEELQAALALPPEPHYRVHVALEKQEISAFGKTFPLRPRMVVDADVILDEVPIWYWLLEPVLTLKGKL